MTASAQTDFRIDWVGTLAQLAAAFPAPQFPKGTWAWTTDFGFVQWNGASWAMQNSGTVAASTTVTQAAGTPINSELCNLTSTAAGAVTLPASYPGMICTLHNISTFGISVFPNAGGTTTEKINAGGSNAAMSLPAGTSTQLTCVVAGQWYSVPRTPS